MPIIWCQFSSTLQVCTESLPPNTSRRFTFSTFWENGSWIYAYHSMFVWIKLQFVTCMLSHCFWHLFLFITYIFCSRGVKILFSWERCLFLLSQWCCCWPQRMLKPTYHSEQNTRHYPHRLPTTEHNKMHMLIKKPWFISETILALTHNITPPPHPPTSYYIIYISIVQ